MVSSPRITLARLWALLILVLGVGVGVEIDLGSLKKTATQTAVVDPRGGRLFLMVLDSLTVADAEALPSLRGLAKDGFRAEVEPCLERITYMCVRETLTGRSAFSLFGLLQNFGHAATDPGESLLRLARQEGRSVAMVSAGDLAPFAHDLDDEFRSDKHFTEAETTTAIAYAQAHDLVVYHYIWHDTEAHHVAPDSKAYQASLAEMDRVVKKVLAGLPKDTSIVVTGDHGHTADGRHVQGQDIPTVVIARSPRLVPVHPEGRIPITAVRFLGSAATGLWSGQMAWDPSWASWLRDPPPAVQAHLAAGEVATSRGFPVATLVAVGVLAIFVAFLSGGATTVAVLAAGLGLGVVFEAWLDVMHFPGKYPRLYEVAWALPLVAGVGTGAFRRSWHDLGRAVALGTAAALILLFPVPHHYGVLKNAGWMGVALLAAAVVPALFAGRVGVARGLALAAGAALFAYGWTEIVDVKVFNLVIEEYRARTWALDHRGPALLLLVASAVFTQAVATKALPPSVQIGSSALVGFLVLGIPALPPIVYALSLGCLLVGLFLRGDRRVLVVGLAGAASSPLLYGEPQRFGVYALTALVALGLLIQAAAQPSGRDVAEPSTVGPAALLVIGGYMALAWTMGLTISGIHFDFLMPIFTGRSHERFWVLIGIATVLQILLPVFLMASASRGVFGSAWGAVVAGAGARITSLRVAAIAAFAFGWMATSGEAAGGLRLAGVLQDALYWQLVGLTLLGGWKARSS